MVSPSIQKLVITLLVLFVMAFLGYRLITEVPVKEATANVTSTEIVGQDILVLVEKLKTVAIDESFFGTGLFSNLRDFSSEITPEAQGRVNPFAIIGTDINGSINQSTQASQSNRTTTNR